jgi:hypothetical protein
MCLRLFVVGLWVFTTWSLCMSRSLSLWVFTTWSLCMSRSLTAWSCWASLVECSRSSFALTVVCMFLLFSLPMMLLTTVSGKYRLWVLDYILDSVACVELPKMVFTSRARWVLLWHRVIIFCLNVTLSQMFYLLKHLLLLHLVISKQSCNNLISTLIMSLYASFVCLCILTSSKISRSILRQRTPHLWGGSIIVSIRARLELNTHSKHLKITTTLTVRTLNPYKDYSSLLRWQGNLCVHIATTELCQWRYVVIFGVLTLFCCWWHYFLFVAFSRTIRVVYAFVVDDIILVVCE